MILSTKSKLAMLVAGSLLLLAAGASFFTKQSIEKTMLEEQYNNAVNAVNLATVNARDRQHILFRTKVAQAEGLKGNMATLLDIMGDLARTHSAPIDFLRHFPLPQGVDIVVTDTVGRVQYASSGIGKSNPALLYDMKDRPVGKTMFRLSSQGLPATCIVGWEKNGHYQRFYGTHFHLPKHGLLVGLWAGIDALEKEQSRIRRQNIAALNSTFSGISLGKTGIIFAMNSAGKMVVGNNVIQNQGIKFYPKNDEPLLQALSRAGSSNFATQIAVRIVSNIPTGYGEVASIADSPLADGTVERDAQLFVRYDKLLDWYIVGLAYLDEAQAPGKHLSSVLILALAGSVLCILPFVMVMLTRLTEPLSRLAEYARKIPEQNFEKPAEFSAELVQLSTQTGGSEAKELAASFLFMEKTLRERVKELMESTSARERMAGELATATEIQMNMLPAPLSASISDGRFGIAATLVPAREVGGDLYDFFMLDDTHLCFVVGDVCDKGVPASLFMSMTLTLIRSHAASTPSPEKLMSIVNASLARGNNTCMFVTLLIGVLDLTTGDLQFSNGGHNRPLIVSPNNECRWLDGVSGPVVGPIDDAEYGLLHSHITAGESIFLYTDGVNEAMNAKKEEFSYDAMEKTLSLASSNEPHKLMEAMLNAVAIHVQDEPASDDITVLAIQYMPKGKTANA